MTGLSVVMATADGAAFVDRQIESIVSQAVDEIVVVDDASTDDTRERIEAWRRRGHPITLFTNPERLGAAATFTAAVQRATGEVVVFADQDDRWRPDRVATLVRHLEDHPDDLLVFGDLGLIDEADRPIPGTQWGRLGFGRRRRRRFRRQPLAVLMAFNVVTGAAMAVRSPLPMAALPVPPGWLHDEWLAVVAAARGAIGMIDRVLVDYRVHTAQAVGAAPGGRRGRVAVARGRIDADYYHRQAERSAVAAERLQAMGLTAAAEGFTARHRHYLRRAEMSQHRVLRLSGVLGELLGGRYHRFDHGWAGAAWDLLRPGVTAE